MEDKIQQKLKDLIKENPTLPIKVFVADDAVCGDFSREEGYISSAHIDKLALLEEGWQSIWCNEEDYPDSLYDYLAYEEELKGEELEAKFNEEMAKVKFEKFIVINIG